MARILSARLAASSDAAEVVWISTSLPSCDQRLLGTSWDGPAVAEDISWSAVGRCRVEDKKGYMGEDWGRDPLGTRSLGPPVPGNREVSVVP